MHDWQTAAAKEIVATIERNLGNYRLREPLSWHQIAQIIKDHFDDWFEDYQWNQRDD